ncbi:hypothetical protein LUZ60_004043 [Juncus effusus]|nr:hypothetical protein LUZ60_004043 [Juncus effusus]
MGELVFFDVETTMPNEQGNRSLLEFGAILVCPRKLVEIGSYCTLVRPADISVVPQRLNGITRESISSAPPFENVADHIFKIMNGRVWVGHNIRRFDCHRIREAFAEIGQEPPEPIGMIDSLNVLSQGFGRRAGDLKMATLASYFKIGQQTHRSLDDARMNLEVIKHCATVLFLESSLPDVLSNKSMGMVTRSRSNTTMSMTPPTSCVQEASRKSPPTSCAQEASRKSPPTSSTTSHRTAPYSKDRLGKVVVERARYALRSRPLNTLLRHSRCILKG